MDHQRITKLIRRHLPEVQGIYLFGSAARDEARSDSDIDIAVLCSEALASVGKQQVHEELELALGIDVDLVDLRDATTVMRSQVLTTGIRLFESDARAVDAFEDFVYADYARLNEEREAIIDDVRRRGSIHAG